MRLVGLSPALGRISIAGVGACQPPNFPARAGRRPEPFKGLLLGCSSSTVGAASNFELLASADLVIKSIGMALLVILVQKARSCSVSPSVQTARARPVLFLPLGWRRQ